MDWPVKSLAKASLVSGRPFELGLALECKRVLKALALGRKSRVRKYQHVKTKMIFALPVINWRTLDRNVLMRAYGE